RGERNQSWAHGKPQPGEDGAGIVRDATEDDVSGVARAGLEMPATELSIRQDRLRKSAQCDRWNFCLTAGCSSLRIGRPRTAYWAATTGRLSRRSRYRPPSRAIRASFLGPAPSQFSSTSCQPYASKSGTSP